MDADMGNADQEARETLIAEIERAFDGVQRGDGVTLNQTCVLDDYGDEEEQAKARRKDTDNRWQDVPKAKLEWHSCAVAMSFLDAIGFRYYIPAFMRWAVRCYDLPRSEAPGNIISGLDPGELGDSLYEYNMSRFRILNEAQATAVAHFLQFFAGPPGENSLNDDTAREALDHYWHQFL